MPLKIFNKKGGNNQYTVKLKIDLISNVSYAYPKDTEFEIEWKRGVHRGVLPNVYMQSDGDIKPSTQFLIPCQFLKQKSDQGGEEFAPKSLIVNLRKVESKKKTTKIATLQIDLSHMANKLESDKEKQYSSTMKGIIDQEFKPYIEFTTSVYKGLLSPEDFNDKSVFIAPINVSPPIDDTSISHSLYSDGRRNSVSSVSSELSEYSNIQETSSSIGFGNNNNGNKKDHKRSNSNGSNNSRGSNSSKGSNGSNGINGGNQKKISPTSRHQRSTSDPFEFNFESTTPVTFSRKSLRNSTTLDDDPLNSPSDQPIFSSDEEVKESNNLNNNNISPTNYSNRSISPTNSTQSLETFDKDIENQPTLAETPTKSKKKMFSFSSKKKSKASPESNQRKNSKPENLNVSKIKGDEISTEEFSSGSESGGSPKPGKWKRRHSTPNVGFFSIKSFKDKEKQKEKEKEKEKEKKLQSDFYNTNQTLDNLTINETNENEFEGHHNGLDNNNNSNSNNNNNNNNNNSSMNNENSSKNNKKSKNKKQSFDSNSSTSPTNKQEKSKDRKNSKEKNFINKLTTSLNPNSSNNNNNNNNINNSNGSDSKDTLQSSLVTRHLDEKLKFLIDDMIVSKRPEYVGNIPISAIAIYKCIFEWKELSPNNNKCLTEMIETFDLMIKKKNIGKEKSFYWLSNSFTLGFLLEKSYENQKISRSEFNTSPSINFSHNTESQNLKLLINIVQGYQRSFWSLYWDSVKLELSKVMDRLTEQLRVKEFETTPIFLNFLLSTLEFLEKRLPFQSVWPNIFKQIFFYVSGYLVNKFLTDNSLATTNNAVNTKLFISSLSQWFQENKELNYFYYFKMEMSTLVQILDVLVIDKDSLKDELVRKEICPSLTTTQLAIVLCRFNPENSSEEVDPAVIKYLQDEGIRKHDIQNITTNLDKIYELPDKPEPSRSIIDTKIPLNIFPQSNQKLFKFLTKPTTIY
ncbi:dilute domain-containing protein [Dictyostelium discoideum AX4]|uniref:Dilute domain-containing protein n=1 Tax=Dictyostelium discoideum TaxID=44689 RepID=B0G181_DICDI|nr:dilute domain-containing protein [Dictyostelium discoideum AX4]EDR41025.1 dilute domain-containing protein [Dictyostelium discoideum AX4]|eukprot:XP_001733044.1 dilute domain-containing protein [Dictyostelium discoideum AX4]